MVEARGIEWDEVDNGVIRICGRPVPAQGIGWIDEKGEPGLWGFDLPMENR